MEEAMIYVTQKPVSMYSCMQNSSIRYTDDRTINVVFLIKNIRTEGFKVLNVGQIVV